MGQKASVSARGQSRSRWTARSRAPPSHLDDISIGDDSVSLLKDEQAQHQCRQPGKPVTVARRWRVWRRLPSFIGGPFKQARQASRQALGRLRRFRRARRLRSGSDGAAGTPQPPSSTERRREAYLLRLGISHRSGEPLAKRSCKYRTVRTAALVKSSECLEFVVEETARRSLESSSSLAPGRSASMLSRTLTEISDSSEDCNAPSHTVSEVLAGQTSPDNQARMKFLQKLSYQRVWVPKPQRAPSHQTVIIFDWDDTLLCTSFLNILHGMTMLPTQEPSSVKRVLKEIENLVITLLESALRQGQTFIITNAAMGWVEQSAAEFLPGVLPVLRRVNVVSARSRQEATYPNEVAKWKAETFMEVQRQLDSQVITNLVSLGDSHFEMEATLAMGQQFEQATIKTIKFKESPSPEELARQQELVCRQFDSIVGDARDLRVRILAPQDVPGHGVIREPK